MKSFATLIVVAASAAVATAQVTYDNTTHTFICPTDNPNGAFCAGDSLKTNIILRCTNGIGYPGNCNDDLSGYFPSSSEGSECWQTSSTSGDAACAKNCIVEGGSGNSPTFTLPNCTPLVESSTTSVSSPTGTPTPTGNGTQWTTSTVSTTLTSTISSCAPEVTNCPYKTAPVTTTIATVYTTYCPVSTSTTPVYPTSSPVTESWTTYTTPASTSWTPSSSVVILPSGTGTGSGSTGTGTPNPPTNGTTTTGGGSSGSGSSPTKTPVGPTSATPTQVTGGASANKAGSAVAVLGLVVAYFL